MYIRTVRNNSGQAYYQLVESFRDNGQVKKRILLALGKVQDHKIQDLAQAIARHQNTVAAFDIAKSISIKDTFVLGPLWILDHLFEKLGLKRILGQIGQRHPRLGLCLARYVFTLVACRFLQPSSKLKVYEYWAGKLYPEMVEGDIKLHRLYRTMGLLAAHKDQIEHELYVHGRDLLNIKVDVVLYDLTTLRFESTRTDLGSLRQFGYSKEMRRDCTQVVFGLLVDPEGMPLAFEVYPGNTCEAKTLKDIVKRMRSKFQVQRFIFVADRGLFSEENLKLLRQDKGEFILGMKLGIFKNRYDEFYDLARFRCVNESFYVYETEHETDRLIITWSRAWCERDQKARADILEKIMEKMNSRRAKPQTFISHPSYRRYVRIEGENRVVLNEDAIQEDSRRDGFFGILTNVRDLSAQEILIRYKELWKIEDAFGQIKGNTLKARPIFHWRDNQIIGHLMLCFLSYLCEAYLTKVLREKGTGLLSKAIQDGTIDHRPLTVSEAMKELCEVRAIPVQFNDQNKLWVRTDIQGNAARLFSAIGMKLPSRILATKEKV